MKKSFYLLSLMLCCLTASAQRSKMTSFVQKYAEEGTTIAAEQAKTRSTEKSLLSADDQSAAYDSIPKLMVLVRCSDANLLSQYGCSILSQWSDIYAVNIPITELDNVAALPEVERIEANEPSKLCNDITAKITQAYDARTTTIGNTTGFTGKGVIIGIVDCGFDFTNPTFRTADNSDTRIKLIWDILDTSSGGSAITATYDFSDAYNKYNIIYPSALKTGVTLPGRLYTSVADKPRSCDAVITCHATHVLGIAAGNGVPSIAAAGAGKYSGMAPEAEIIAVANATQDNETYWKSNTTIKYYSNVCDLLAYKYIFDYADSQNKPCVLNLSQGYEAKDFISNNGEASHNLQMEVVQSMLGPGHIFCAAAGNSETSTNTNTIFYPACVDGVIGVGNAYYGSYGNEERAFRLKNYTGAKRGEINSSSSCGPAPLTGTIKPDVVAPGTCLISALDHYYGENKVSIFGQYQYVYNGVQYKWANITGTSMAAPVVSGIVAQWLQLCPTLTPAQVLDVIKNTSTQDQDGVEYPNNKYGYGCINALKGLEYISKTYTGIENVSADGAAYGTNSAPQYYDLLGRKVSESQAHGGIFLVRQGSRTVKIAR